MLNTEFIEKIIKDILEPFIENDYENNNYDLIIASQAYRAINYQSKS